MNHLSNCATLVPSGIYYILLGFMFLACIYIDIINYEARQQRSTLHYSTIFVGTTLLQCTIIYHLLSPTFPL